jgi:hypothetical protein
MITVVAVLGRNTSVSSEKNSILVSGEQEADGAILPLLLWLYCTHNSVSHFTSSGNLTTSLNVKTVRGIFKATRQCMLGDILDQQQDYKLGGVDDIVEIDESKFGKRK